MKNYLIHKILSFIQALQLILYIMATGHETPCVCESSVSTFPSL